MGKPVSKLVEASRRVGKSDPLFTMMRQSPDKFKYIGSLYPSDIATAYGKYEIEISRVKVAFEELYFELLEKRKAYAFSRHLHSIGIYNSDTYYMSFIHKILGRTEPSVSFSSYLKMKQVLKEYESFNATD